METKKNLFKLYLIVLMILAFLPANKIYSQDNNTKDASPTIEIKQTDAIKALTIKVEIPTSDIGNKLGALFTRLYTYIETNQIQPNGPAFVVFLKFDPSGNTEFIVGAPISAEAKGDSDIIFKEFPSMKVVSSIFIGPYEKMMPVYESMGKFMKENKLESNGETWEVYLTNPEEEKDPNKYQTLIYFPVKQ